MHSPLTPANGDISTLPTKGTLLLCLDKDKICACMGAADQAKIPCLLGNVGKKEETAMRLFSAVLGLLCAGIAVAQTNTSIIVTPSSPVFGSGGNNVVGVPQDAAPGYQFGSFASNGTAKTDMYFPPQSLFGRAVTVGEVTAISYWTKKGTLHTSDPGDWYLTIYTEPYTGHLSTSGWYGDRYGAEPYFSVNLDAPANAWNQWSTDGPDNKLRFFESTQGAPGANFGSYTDPDWDTFKAAAPLSGIGVRANQSILYFSLQTASGWAAGFTGQLDGLRIQLSDGSVATINFEPYVVATTRDACKGSGWQTLFRANGSVFKNQGDCVQYVNTGK
jgi:hypothetical protein